MTETTKEQKEVEAIIQSLEGENNNFKRMAQIIEGLINYSKQLEEQVTSLTKERDEIKFKARDHSHMISAVIKAKNKLQDDVWAHKREINNLKSHLSNREKEIEPYENFKDSVIRSIKDCREVEPTLADCFERTCGVHVLLASLKSKGEAQ